MVESLSPFVYWGQNKDQVSLKIDLKDASVEIVDITEDGLKFVAQGVGLMGNNHYEFELQFYHSVEKEQSRYKVTDRHIEVSICKKGGGEIWPRLTHKQVKLPWLKIDFDKFAFDDDTDSQEEDFDKFENVAEREMLDRIENEMKDVEIAAKADIKMGYLFLYNMFQFVGFTYVFVALQYRYIKLGEDSKKTALESVGLQLMVCQLAAMLEIVHAVLGIVKTGVLSPLMQVLSRNFMLFVVILQEPRLQDTPAVWYLFVIWSGVELVRYPYYMLQCVNMEIRLMSWLRYSLWVPLYPLGFLAEGTIVVMAIPLYEDTGKLSIDLPNFANMPFSFPIYLRLHLVMMCAASYFLLSHMNKLRKKKLNFPDTSKRKSVSKTKKKTN